MVVIKIFDAKDTNFNTAGNIIIEPLYCHEIKKKSLNGWYIDVEIPINYKEFIEQDKLCVVQTKSKLNPQAFRIKDIEYTTNKIVFQAQHVMFDAEDYFLLDSRPTNQNGLNALNYINGMTDKVSPFTMYSNVENISTAYLIRKNLLEAWSIIEERWGGIFDADNWNISFLTSVGNDNGETIYYGKNLEDMKIIEDWSGVCTKLYPVGKDEIMLADKYLESTIQYDIPYTRTINFDTELSDEEQTQENLLIELETNATNYLQENCVPKVCYEINSNINQDMEIGDIIQVKHPLCNISTEVLEYEYDAILRKITKLVFGNYSKDVKKKFKAVTSTIESIKEAVNKQQTTINNQTNLINSLNKNGYVYIDENEILLLDAIPKEEAKNVWRFGLAGIGFSSNGYEGPFEIAITMDGQINANFITTGTMSVSRIEGLANFISETEKQISEIEIEQGNITSRVSSVETLANNAQSTADSAVEGVNNITNTQGEAEGKNIHIEDSAEEPFVDISLHGESSQKTRSGKNIFNNTKNFSAVTYNSDNDAWEFNITNRYDHLITKGNLNIEANTDYVLVLDIVENTLTGGMSFYTSNTVWLTDLYINKEQTGIIKKQLHSRDDLESALYDIWFWHDNTITGNFKAKIMLCKGILGTEGDYEQYGVMPSPDYPSEIENLEGRNKLIFEDVEETTINGVTYSIKNGVITLNGTATALFNIYGKDFKLEKEGYYTLSRYYSGTYDKGSATDNSSLLIQSKTDDTYSNKIDYNFGYPSVSRADNYSNGTYRARIFGAKGNTYTNYKLMPQLEYGTVATPYVPYNSIEFKVEGKNLWDEQVEIGRINTTTGQNEATSNNIRSKNYINIKALETYYLYNGSLLNGAKSKMLGFFYDKDKNFISNTSVNNTSFTAPENAKYFRFYCATDYGTTYKNDIMIAKGSTATDYEPYKSQVVTFPLEEGEKLYQGSFLNDNGKNHVRGQVVFDGSDDEDWQIEGTNNFYSNIVIQNSKSLSLVLCNYQKSTQKSLGASENCFISTSKKFNFQSDTINHTVADFKNWLSTHNLIVEYDLAEPETVPYTEVQQEAWNKIKALMTYKNVTNITSDAYSKVIYMRDNGLDVYETKQNAEKKYTETTEKFAETKMTTDAIKDTVSKTQTILANNYDELKTKFDDYAPKSDVINLQTWVEKIQTDTYTKTEINTKLTDGSVTKVLTTAGTFDENGLTIEKTNAKTKGNFNETGIKVEDATSGSNEELLFAGYDEELGETIVRSKNMTVEKYLTIKGISRKEKYTNPVLGGKGVATYIL